MRQELSLEIVVTPGDDPLARVTTVMGDTVHPPECFVWSSSAESDEARVWITLDESEPKVRELVTEFGKIAGVRRVVLHGPGQRILEALVRPRR